MEKIILEIRSYFLRKKIVFQLEELKSLIEKFDIGKADFLMDTITELSELIYDIKEVIKEKSQQ